MTVVEHEGTRGFPLAAAMGNAGDDGDTIIVRPSSPGRRRNGRAIGLREINQTINRNLRTRTVQEHNNSKTQERPSRRDFLKTTAALGGAALAAPSTVVGRPHRRQRRDQDRSDWLRRPRQRSGRQRHERRQGRATVAMADIFADHLEGQPPAAKEDVSRAGGRRRCTLLRRFDAYQKLIHSGVDAVLIACYRRTSIPRISRLPSTPASTFSARSRMDWTCRD